VRLLFDENVSPRLVQMLADAFDQHGEASLLILSVGPGAI